MSGTQYATYVSEVFLGALWMVLGVMLVEIVAIEATYEALFLYAYDHILELRLFV